MAACKHVGAVLKRLQFEVHVVNERGMDQRLTADHCLTARADELSLSAIRPDPRFWIVHTTPTAQSGVCSSNR